LKPPEMGKRKKPNPVTERNRGKLTEVTSAGRRGYFEKGKEEGKRRFAYFLEGLKKFCNISNV